MKRNHRGSIGVALRALTLVVLLGFCATAGYAASISYGNFGPVPPGVTFENVTESSGTDSVPLFGPPTPFSIGLDFDPMSFVAFASGGGIDITDGQLNFGIQTTSNLIGINAINLFEAGDYSLAGVGTAATQALAGAIMRVTVTEIDGMAVAPINLAPSNAFVAFNLVANPGIVQPWSVGLSLNIASQLAGMGISFTTGATGLEVSIDNQLLAFSEPGSLAFISKKEFQIGVEPNVVPEPASAVLLGIGGLMVTAVWFRRRNARRA